MIEFFVAGESGDEADAEDIAAAGDGEAAEGGDVAILFGALEEEREPVDFAEACEVPCGEDGGVVRAFRGDLEAEADGVGGLPEIVVGETAVETEGSGAFVVAVVEFDAAVEREGVLGFEVDVDGAGGGALFEVRGDAEVALTVVAEDGAVDVGEVEDGAFCEFGDGGGDGAGGMEATAADAEPADGVFGDLEEDDAGVAVLGGDLDGDGGETCIVIGFFEGGAGEVDVCDGAGASEEGVDGFFDGEWRERAGAFDAVLADGERVALGGGGIRGWEWCHEGEKSEDGGSRHGVREWRLRKAESTAPAQTTSAARGPLIPANGPECLWPGRVTDEARGRAGCYLGVTRPPSVERKTLKLASSKRPPPEGASTLRIWSRSALAKVSLMPVRPLCGLRMRL